MRQTDAKHPTGHHWAAVSLLAVVAVLVCGYHPFAEDGGVYVAGVKRLIDPGLYGPHAEFVTEHLRFSWFAPMVAGMVRVTHLPLAWVLVMLYVATTWLTLFAGWMIAARMTASRAGRFGVVTLLACWLTLPIAGTSLMLLDPYVTARSFSTPLILMAMAWGMDARDGGGTPLLCATAALAVAACLHPLMAGYGAGAVVLLMVYEVPTATRRRWWLPMAGALALTLASVVQWRGATESQDYVRIALTRYYWFPFAWRWYEQAGLVAPLMLIAALGLRGDGGRRAPAQAAIGLGVIAAAIAVLFSREGLASHVVARLQPLRAFQIVYEVMIVLLGAWLGERWLRRSAWRWCGLVMVCGGSMFVAQRQIYAHSAHLEMPWRPVTNAWVQAFLWVREHTPEDALFALDARYITRGKGEDAQCFRPIAERDALPDYSKDGGEAAITPALTEDWVRGEAAQEGLNDESDAVRAQKLKPLAVSWVVLESRSQTAWMCPYTNDIVKVCRLP